MNQRKMTRTNVVIATLSVMVVIAATAWLWNPWEPRMNGGEGAIHLAKVGELNVPIEQALEQGGSPFLVQPSIEQAPTQENPVLAAGSSLELESSAMAMTPLDVSTIARGFMDDATFESIVQELKSDPVLLQQLIDEFRQEQDPERRAQLARFLGEAGGPAATLTASELIYSGDADSRQLGLKLLQYVQPTDQAARDIASSLLTTEIEAPVLLGTLSALATPGTVDEHNRAFLSDQVALLASHEDAAVRGISLDILSRWSTDGRDTAVLVNGLSDSNERVRESAAYALVNHEDPNEAVMMSLWSVVRNESESKSIRSAAMLALRSQSLSDEQGQELQLIERSLNTVIR